MFGQQLQKRGWPTGAGAGKTGTTGQTTTIIQDDLIDLIGSINSAYRTQQRRSLAFQMADSSFKVIRKLMDSANRPLYLPDDGETGETLLGYPVQINPDVPAMADNAKSVAFGKDYLGYLVDDVMEVTLMRMADSVFASKGQIGYLAIARGGGAVVDSNAIRARAEHGLVMLQCTSNYNSVATFDDQFGALISTAARSELDQIGSSSPQ
ncbi:MAG: phage major capsid protein [Steroidobacteraceae bacterium]